MTELCAFDTIFVEMDLDMPGMLGIDIAQVHIFFSFKYNGAEYHCALVDWFSCVGDTPDEDTGMWVVECDYDIHNCQLSGVIHIDTMIRCSHLICVYGAEPVSMETKFSDSLYAFNIYYVNKYADHHSFEFAI